MVLTHEILRPLQSLHTRLRQYHFRLSNSPNLLNSPSSATTPGKVLEMLGSLRGELTIPVILFTYSNPLLNRGMEAFCRDAAAAGAAGLVVPDLPLEEAEKLSAIAAEQALRLAAAGGLRRHEVLELPVIG